MKIISVEEMNDACGKEYNENYSHGGYCHEQSFRFGFQEGTEFCEQAVIDKASKICAKVTYQFCPNMFRCGEELAEVEEMFRNEMEK